MLELVRIKRKANFCLNRCLTCFRTFLFVTTKDANIRLDCVPLDNGIPNKKPKIMFTTIVSAREVFRVKKGMVLIVAVLGVDEPREKQATISETITKKAVVLPAMM